MESALWDGSSTCHTSAGNWQDEAGTKGSKAGTLAAVDGEGRVLSQREMTQSLENLRFGLPPCTGRGPASARLCEEAAGGIGNAGQEARGHGLASSSSLRCEAPLASQDLRNGLATAVMSSEEDEGSQDDALVRRMHERAVRRAYMWESTEEQSNTTGLGVQGLSELLPNCFRMDDSGSGADGGKRSISSSAHDQTAGAGRDVWSGGDGASGGMHADDVEDGNIGEGGQGGQVPWAIPSGGGHGRLPGVECEEEEGEEESEEDGEEEEEQQEGGQRSRRTRIKSWEELMQDILEEADGEREEVEDEEEPWYKEAVAENRSRFRWEAPFEAFFGRLDVECVGE